MTKLIAVTGGTGQQGGSVARIMLETPGWDVRIITRNQSSDAAKALVVKGATVVQANFDDQASVEKAFEVTWYVYTFQETADGINSIGRPRNLCSDKLLGAPVLW
jgi:nucleoside-diphosphate-sugar epimerase